jgi:hypothetical protein
MFLQASSWARSLPIDFSKASLVFVFSSVEVSPGKTEMNSPIDETNA